MYTSCDQTILNKPNLSFGLSRAILLITTINLVVSLGTNFFRGFCRVWQWRIRILYRRCDFFNSRRNLCGCLLYELGCGGFREVLQKGLGHKKVSDTSSYDISAPLKQFFLNFWLSAPDSSMSVFSVYWQLSQGLHSFKIFWPMKPSYTSN